MQRKNSTHSPQRNALILSLLLGIIILGSILWIVTHSNSLTIPTLQYSNNNTTSPISLYADIYQNGELIQSIHLSTVTESYTMTIYDDEQKLYNQVEVRPGSIGIVSASCPDKLCVHQGFISNSLLPITCLPNRLVIQLRQQKNNTENTESSHNTNKITPDIITY